MVHTMSFVYEKQEAQKDESKEDVFMEYDRKSVLRLDTLWS